jgi:hypothetical protein
MVYPKVEIQREPGASGQAVNLIRRSLQCFFPARVREGILIGFSIAAFVASTAPSLASIGLAEWGVYTPGGNLISHEDGWKERYGDCLRADDADFKLPSEERQKVYVAFLQRWRYYKNYVVGESKAGFFLFNETSKKVTYIESEAAFLQAIANQNLGTPKSNWLTGQDGWTEAWLPMLWKPCQSLLSATANPVKPSSDASATASRQACEKTFSPENLALYRETTWGRTCQKLKDNQFTDATERQNWQTFCHAILDRH